jgi:dolichol-phosphate mannosyltransferase
MNISATNFSENSSNKTSVSSNGGASSLLTVLIPTLNEEENIDLLVERILSARVSCNYDFDILFVDSASSDNTCARIADWQDKAPVSLLRREVNLGLAGAVIAGAIHSPSQYLLIMDADLSHPPEDIPRLLGPLLDQGYDMVVGSRYVQGGATPDWPIARRISSRLATLPALLFCEY